MPVDIAAAVIGNDHLSDDYNVVRLSAPAIGAAAAPGQFVMVKAGRGHDPLLRRPFSVFEILRDTEGTPQGISILNKRIGVSTALLYDARPGQRIDCLGPLGRPFTIVEPPAEAWMIAGGVGLAPFAALGESLGTRGVRTTLFYGARRAAELFFLDLFKTLGVDLVLTTEDGSAGERGRIAAPLERQLAAQDARPATSPGPGPSGPLRPGPLMLYACGPEGMLAACARLAARFGRPCQVSVERVMGCGMGGCYSCVVPMRGDDGRYHHVRSCLAGPVIPADQIMWE
jgi:dihydroorotate dehydrogenase electron transfer subunit